MKTYDVITTNGVRHSIKANSAGDAIQVALERALTFKVSSCECDLGNTRFDIPNHDALPADYKPKRRTKAQDQSEPMFNDDAIRAESINAKEKRDRGNAAYINKK